MYQIIENEAKTQLKLYKIIKNNKISLHTIINNSIIG